MTALVDLMRGIVWLVFLASAAALAGLAGYTLGAADFAMPPGSPVSDPFVFAVGTLVLLLAAGLLAALIALLDRLRAGDAAPDSPAP